MWQRKMDYLKQTYEYNKTHGKDMYGANRVCYDLAILINKYDRISISLQASTVNDLPLNTKAYIRIEATFLLSENLAS